MKGMNLLIILTIAGFLISGLWNNIPIVKKSVHAILDPTAGALLNFHSDLGMVLIVLILTILITIVQKYTIDQEAMRKLRAEQKLLSEEMKKYRDHPEKIMELQKKSIEMIPRTFELTLKSSFYTIIPFIFLFRWFGDYFAAMPTKIFGFLGWFPAYIILAIALSFPVRKLLKVA